MAKSYRQRKNRITRLKKATRKIKVGRKTQRIEVDVARWRLQCSCLWWDIEVSDLTEQEAQERLEEHNRLGPHGPKAGSTNGSGSTPTEDHSHWHDCTSVTCSGSAPCYKPNCTDSPRCGFCGQPTTIKRD